MHFYLHFINFMTGLCCLCGCKQTLSNKLTQECKGLEWSCLFLHSRKIVTETSERNSFQLKLTRYSQKDTSWDTIKSAALKKTSVIYDCGNVILLFIFLSVHCFPSSPYYAAESLSWYSRDRSKQAWTPLSFHNLRITPVSSADITPSSALLARANSWRASSCQQMFML